MSEDTTKIVSVTGEIDDETVEKIRAGLDSAGSYDGLAKFRRDHGRAAQALIMALCMPPLFAATAIGFVVGLVLAVPGLALALLAAIPHWIWGGRAMTRTTALLALALLACTPGQPDTLGDDTSSEASTGTEEAGDGDPARGDGDGETTGATETGETGPGDGDGDGVGDGDAGEEHPAACFVPGETACYIPPFGVPPYGDDCPPGEEDPCDAGLKACTEPANLCMIVGEGEDCPPGWINACE